MENNTTSNNEILKLVNVTKDFYPSLPLSKILTLNFKPSSPTRALDDISFSLGRGKILGILGPNGAGKTTLLKIISTLILQDTGTVTVNGIRLGTNDEKIKATIGLVASSERSFYWRLTGRQNLEFFAALYGMDRRRAASRIAELCKLFDITYADKRFDSYSTGMQQNFGLMRALLHEPQLLLLDEPTKSLDYASAMELRDFIKEKLVGEQRKTVIFTTHQMDEAADFANLLMILHRGKVFELDTLEELRARVGNEKASLGDIFVRLTRRGQR